MSVRRLLLAALILALALGGCAGRAASGAPDDAPRSVTIAMGYIPNVQFAPMYVALEKGYFADEGLEITLDYGLETDLLQRVAAGDVPFAIANGDQVILARANDLPVTYVYNWYPRFPVCSVSLAEAGIRTPADLVGKTVGIPAMEGASYIGWLGFAEKAGLDPESVNLQVIGYTQVASVVEGRVDAAICYALNEPVQLREAGYEIDVIDFGEYIRLVSAGFVTHDDIVANDPELVRAIIRAFDRGLQDTIADPDAAFAASRRAIPEMEDQATPLQRAVLMESVAFWRSERAGASDPEAWRESVELLQRVGLVTTPLDPAECYTNDLIE